MKTEPTATPALDRWFLLLSLIAVMTILGFLCFKWGGVTALGESDAEFPKFFRGWIGGHDERGGLSIGLNLSPLNLIALASAFLIGGVSLFAMSFTRGEGLGLTLTALFSGLSVAASTPWLSLWCLFLSIMGATLFQLGRSREPEVAARLAYWSFERSMILISLAVFLLIYFSSEPANFWADAKVSAHLAVESASPVLLYGVGLVFLFLTFSSPLFSLWEAADDRPESLIVEGMLTLAATGLIQKLTGLFADAMVSRLIVAASLGLLLTHFVFAFLSNRSRPLWGVWQGIILIFAVLTVKSGMADYLPLLAVNQLFLLAIFSLGKEKFSQQNAIVGFAAFMGAGGAGSVVSALFLSAIGYTEDLFERIVLTLLAFFVSFVVWRIYWLAQKPKAKAASSRKAMIVTIIYIVPLFGLLWTGRVLAGMLGFSNQSDLIFPILGQWFLRGPNEVPGLDATGLDQSFLMGSVLYWAAHLLAIFFAYWSTAVSQGAMRKLAASKAARVGRRLEKSWFSALFEGLEKLFRRISAKLKEIQRPKFLKSLEMPKFITASRMTARLEEISWDGLTRAALSGVQTTSRFARALQRVTSRGHLAAAIWIGILLWIYLSKIYLNFIHFGGG